MKTKLISALLVTSTLLSATVFANPYQNQFQPANTIAAINNMGPYIDDYPVNLTGQLGHQIGPEHFNFTDSEGNTAIVEIDFDEQYHFGIKPNTPISFFGEAEKEYGHLKIELKFVNAAQLVKS